MVKFNKFFTICISLVIFYTLAMILFSFDGFSLLKLTITFCLWLSVIISIFYFVKKYKKLKLCLPNFSFKILLFIITLNIVSIIRSLLFSDELITTTLGNIYTSLALLTPFFIVFFLNKKNIIEMRRYFFSLLRLGIVISLFYFVIPSLQVNELSRILLLLFLPSIFLATTIIFESNSKKKLIIISLLLLFYNSYLLSNRTMMIREILLILIIPLTYFLNHFNSKFSLKVFYLLLMIPFYFLINSYNSEQSAIAQNLSIISDQEMNDDTRTFLYIEVLEDLIVNDSFLFGKGSSGTYFSPYFNTQAGSSDTRLTVEVGILAILLKTGFLGLILNLLLLLNAIYYALFKSKNLFVTAIGLMLGLHFFILFVENIISYSIYNLCIWFFIGLCLSKEIRNMSNLEFKIMLNPKNKLH